jgi:FHS family Na+ dependent glucose MFS transporter 1
MSTSSQPISLPVDSHSQIAQRTAAYFAALVGLGLFTAALGPTLPSLAENTRSELSQVSILFTARSFGYLLGSLGLGRAFDRFSGHALLATVLLGMALMLGIIPALSYLWLLTLVLLLLGVGEGALDVGANLLLVWTHRQRATPYLNALHFFFGVGAFLSPMIVAMSLRLTSGISWAFWALAFFGAPIALWLLRLPSPVSPHSLQEQQAQPTKGILVVAIAAFFALYVGAEASFGGWIYTYALALGMGGVDSAAYLTSAFWGSFTIGRLAAVPLASRFQPRAILLAGLLGSLFWIGLIALLPANQTVLWLSSLGYGLAMAALFPTMLAFAGQRMALSGHITRWFFVGAGLGGMSLPWLIGQLFTAYGPTVMIFAILIDLLLALSLFMWSERLSHPV